MSSFNVAGWALVKVAFLLSSLLIRGSEAIGETQNDNIRKVSEGCPNTKQGWIDKAKKYQEERGNCTGGLTYHCIKAVDRLGWYEGCIPYIDVPSK